MEMGDFMEPGQQALYQAEHRGAVKVFGVSSLRRVRASTMGHSQYSLPGTCWCFLLSLFPFFFFPFGHSVELCLRRRIGEDTQAVCIVSVT